jgi:hypothetical protein
MTAQSNNQYLIKINKIIAYMPSNMYTQWATMSEDGKRFYVSRGAMGRLSISTSSAEIISCGIIYF